MQATGTIRSQPARPDIIHSASAATTGSSLTITGANFTTLTNATNSSGTNTMAYVSPRGPGDTLGTTYLAAGSYPVSLVFYQQGGRRAGVLRRQGEQFRGGDFLRRELDSRGQTTATTAGGGASTTTTPLAVASAPFTGTVNSGVFAAAVATNVKPAIASAITAAGGTSLYTRITFNAPNYSSLSSLTLKMQYDDGYVAWLNGVEVASANAPASPTWNSLANEEQTSDVQATTYEEVDVSSFSIRPPPAT